MRLFALVLFLASPAMAYTPEQLLSGRDVPMDCKGEVCTVSKADLQWMLERDQLLNKLMGVAASQLKNCGVRGI